MNILPILRDNTNILADHTLGNFKYQCCITQPCREIFQKNFIYFKYTILTEIHNISRFIRTRIIVKLLKSLVTIPLEVNPTWQFYKRNPWGVRNVREVPEGLKAFLCTDFGSSCGKS